MATVFPTTLDTFTNPVASPPGSETLASAGGSLKHSQLHANVQDAIAALEAKVGVNNSLVAGTLDYLLKHSPVTFQANADGNVGVIVKAHSATQSAQLLSVQGSDNNIDFYGATAGNAPAILASGSDSSISVKLRGKGDSGFVQMGPDTYGASGFSGYNISLEIFRTVANQPTVNEIYVESYAGDLANHYMVGVQVFVGTQGVGATQNISELAGGNYSATASLPSGLTTGVVYGFIGEAQASGGGTVTNGYGIAGQIVSDTGSSFTKAAACEALVGDTSSVSGSNTSYGFYCLQNNRTVPTFDAYALWASDMSNTAVVATNPYFLWLDSPGVFRVKGNGVLAHYNSNFTKYTPGATNFERVVLQWDTSNNVASLGVEAGGTGTLRALRLFGAGVQIGAETGAGPDASSALQVDSTTQGFAPPRMTTTQRNAIGTPLESLHAWDATLHLPYWWNGSAWITFPAGNAGTVTSIVGGTGLTGGTITSTGTLAVNQAFTPTWTGIHTWTLTQAANTSVDGIVLADTTAASSTNQQYSPRIRWTGQGWKTTATAASQAVDWIAENQPVQGTTSPGSNLVFSSQVNGGGYQPIMSLSNAGHFLLTNQAGTVLMEVARGGGSRIEANNSAGGGFFAGVGQDGFAINNLQAAVFGNTYCLAWNSVSTWFGGSGGDTCLYRVAGSVVGVGNAASATPGSGWIQNSAGEAILASAFTDATGTVAVTNLPNKNGPLVAGRYYRVEGNLYVSNSLAADGFQCDFNGGTATITSMRLDFFTAAGSNVPVATSTTTLAGIINYSTVTGTNVFFVQGYIICNAGGSLRMRAATNTHVSGTMSLGIGSWIALHDEVSF